MTYEINRDCEHKIELGKLPNDDCLSVPQGLVLADRVKEYLKVKEAKLVSGPGELSQHTIKTWNNAGEWVYHLMDTTLYAIVRPHSPNGFWGNWTDGSMETQFGAEGKSAGMVISDLQAIIEGCRKL